MTVRHVRARWVMTQRVRAAGVAGRLGARFRCHGRAWVGGYVAKGADIPIWVIGVDAAGNRVSTSGLVRNTHLLVDVVKPTASGTLTQGTWTLEQNYTADATATLAVTTADAAPSGGVARAEYFIGADPGYGNGTSITLVAGAGTATLNLNTLGATDATWLKGGSHTVNVRALDVAGNWGPITAVTATLKPVTVFASGWETPTTGTFGWTGTANVGSAITSSAATPIAGSRGLQVVTTATSTGYQYRTVPTAATPAIGTTSSAHATTAPGTTVTPVVPGGVRVLSLATATANGDFAAIEYRRTAGGAVSFRIGSSAGAASATPSLNFSGSSLPRASETTALSIRPSREPEVLASSYAALSVSIEQRPKKRSQSSLTISDTARTRSSS